MTDRRRFRNVTSSEVSKIINNAVPDNTKKATKRECLGVKKIAEEKEILFKQEQATLRKVRRS